MTIAMPTYLANRVLPIEDFALRTLEERYYLKRKDYLEETPKQCYWRCCLAFSDNLAMAERVYEYILKRWFGPASPVLSNAPVRLTWGLSFKTNFLPERFLDTRGPQPISCFVPYVPDSREGISDYYREAMFLNSNGGGIGAGWNALREAGAPTSTGQKTGGVVAFEAVQDKLVLATNQGSNRRGAIMSEIDVSHPEILEHISLRNPTGDSNRRARNIHIGVNIPDAFMQAVILDQPWDLVSPYDGQVKATVQARTLWEKILEIRVGKGGEPMLHFIDRSNEMMPASQKAKGLRVNNSNLCHEITLANNAERTAVCCLSSINVAHADEFMDHPLFIEDITRFLDNVTEYFIQTACYNISDKEEFSRFRRVVAEALATIEVTDPEQVQKVADYTLRNYIKAMSKAVYSASQERALGIGQMGVHTYLQKKGIAYESRKALIFVEKISKHIQTQARAASKKLAKERGEAPDMVGTGYRNSHLTAMAPTATNAILTQNCSPSGEPVFQNVYVHKTLSGSFLVKNPQLENDLEKLGLNTESVWKSITQHDGSVQHLQGVSETFKKLYKTSFEIDNRWIIDHYAVRQGYICQAQSLNLFVLPTASKTYVNMLHILAWRKGLKTVYYLKSKGLRSGFNQAQESTNGIKIDANHMEVDYHQCPSCEG